MIVMLFPKSTGSCLVHELHTLVNAEKKLRGTISGRGNDNFSHDGFETLSCVVLFYRT